MVQDVRMNIKGFSATNLVEGGTQLSRLAKEVTSSKKSTIFVLYSWNFVKVTTSRVSYFDQVSWE